MDSFAVSLLDSDLRRQVSQLLQSVVVDTSTRSVSNQPAGPSANSANISQADPNESAANVIRMVYCLLRQIHRWLKEIRQHVDDIDNNSAQTLHSSVASPPFNSADRKSNNSLTSAHFDSAALSERPAVPAGASSSKTNLGLSFPSFRISLTSRGRPVLLKTFVDPQSGEERTTIIQIPQKGRVSHKDNRCDNFSTVSINSNLPPTVDENLQDSRLDTAADAAGTAHADNAHTKETRSIRPPAAAAATATADVSADEVTGDYADHSEDENKETDPSCSEQPSVLRGSSSSLADTIPALTLPTSDASDSEMKMKFAHKHLSTSQSETESAAKKSRRKIVFAKKQESSEEILKRVREREVKIVEKQSAAMERARQKKAHRKFVLPQDKAARGQNHARKEKQRTLHEGNDSALHKTPLSPKLKKSREDAGDRTPKASDYSDVHHGGAKSSKASDAEREQHKAAENRKAVHVAKKGGRQWAYMEKETPAIELNKHSKSSDRKNPRKNENVNAVNGFEQHHKTASSAESSAAHSACANEEEMDTGRSDIQHKEPMQSALNFATAVTLTGHDEKDEDRKHEEESVQTIRLDELTKDTKSATQPLPQTFNSSCDASVSASDTSASLSQDVGVPSSLTNVPASALVVPSTTVAKKSLDIESYPVNSKGLERGKFQRRSVSSPRLPARILFASASTGNTNSTLKPAGSNIPLLQQQQLALQQRLVSGTLSVVHHEKKVDDSDDGNVRGDEERLKEDLPRNIDVQSVLAKSAPSPRLKEETQALPEFRMSASGAQPGEESREGIHSPLLTIERMSRTPGTASRKIDRSKSIDKDKSGDDEIEMSESDVDAANPGSDRIKRKNVQEQFATQHNQQREEAQATTNNEQMPKKAGAAEEGSQNISFPLGRFEAQLAPLSSVSPVLSAVSAPEEISPRDIKSQSVTSKDFIVIAASTVSTPHAAAATPVVETSKSSAWEETTVAQQQQTFQAQAVGEDEAKSQLDKSGELEEKMPVISAVQRLGLHEQSPTTVQHLTANRMSAISASSSIFALSSSSAANVYDVVALTAPQTVTLTTAGSALGGNSLSPKLSSSFPASVLAAKDVPESVSESGVERHANTKLDEDDPDGVFR